MSVIDALDPLEALTERQRAVLDLLCDHMTSKTIARELAISATTVDQHIKAVGAKLGTHDRKSTAREYARLKSIQGKITPHFSQVGVPDVPHVGGFPDEAVRPVFTLNDAGSFDGRWVERTPLPHPGDADFSGLWVRLLAIVGIAFGLALVAAAMIAVVNGLNDLI